MKIYPRKKNKILLLSLIYKIGNLLPISPIRKFKLFSKLQWIFWRLSREQIKHLYSLNESPYTTNTINFLKKKLNKNYNVLDLGCGDGALSYQISLHCKNIIGYDYDKSLILKAKDKYKLINNLKFEIAKIPEIFKSNTEYFDLIICSHIIEHLDNYKDLLINLKKYGKNIFIEVPDFDANDLNQVKKKFNIEPAYTDSDHIYEFDRDFLINFFEKNGFKISYNEFKDGVMRFIITH